MPSMVTPTRRRSFTADAPLRPSRLDGEYLLNLKLPFTSKEEVHLLTSGDELVVHVGHQKRNVILPRALVGLRTHGAHLEGDTLTVRFTKKPNRK